jgi:tRNA G37 N-methylase Trm5
MSFERTRLCTLAQNSGISEHILVVFAGVALEAFLLVAKVPSIQSITIIEQNPIAIQCIHSSIRMLRRNKALGTDSETIANKLVVLEGDAQEILPTLIEQHKYHRIIAPRPKEPGTLDGDTGTGSHGAEYLQLLLSLIVLPDTTTTTTTTTTRTTSGVIHWYDFVSEPEFASGCERTRQFIIEQVQIYNPNWNVDFRTIIKVGSTVAKRQLRICIDFCVLLINNNET